MRPLATMFAFIVLQLPSSAQQIEIAVQKGHSGDVLVTAFNGNGTLLASAGNDNLIKLWHIPTGKEMASFVNRTNGDITSLVFEGNDDMLIAGDENGIVSRWNIAASTIESTSHGSTPNQPNQREHLTRDGHRVFVERYYLRKANKATGKIVFSRVPIDISKNFTSVAVDEKSGVVAAGCADGKVYAYNLASGKLISILEGHFSSVNSVAFSRAGDMFASGSSDRSIILWDAKTLKQLKRLAGKSFRFETVSFNHAGTHLAVGDELGRGRIIDLRSSRVRVSVAAWHEQRVADIAFAADDSTIYSGGFDNRLSAVRVNDETQERSTYKHYASISDFVFKKLNAYREPYAWVNTVSASPDGNWIAAGGGWRESTARKQPQPIVVKHTAGHLQQKLYAHRGNVNDICFLNNSGFLSAGSDGLIQWHFDVGSRHFYFRKKKVEGFTNIAKILIVDAKNVLLLSGAALVLYDLEREEIVDSLREDSAITAADYDPESGQLFYAMFDKLVSTTLEKWHTTRQVIPQAHTDKITSIDVNPRRKMLATASWDATIKLWNTGDGSLLATIISIGRDDHMIITPDNYYYGTRNSLRGIGFKYGKQFVSPEQYDLRFNRPDIVLSRLGYVPPEVVRSFNRAYLKRLQKMNFTEDMLSDEIHLPVVKSASDKLPLKTASSALSFDVRAEDSKYNLDRINVFVNNIPAFGVGGIDVRAGNSRELTTRVNLELSAGKNKIQFSCLNEKGVESLTETVEVEYVPEKKIPSTLYIAVVSVSAYRNKTMNLKYARKDGQDLCAILSRSGWFERVVIDTLYDQRATRENILKLRDRFMTSSVNDQVIFFISGHGLLDENLDFYFATHDIDFRAPAARGLRYDELEGLLDGIPARKKLLLMDACHSGEVDKSRIQLSSSSTVMARNQKGTVTAYNYPVDVEEEHYRVGITTSFELMQELFSNLSKGSGAVVISAAAGNSYALESDEWKNGVFTYALLSGLRSRTADRNRDREITVTELKDFVAHEVETLTNGAQRPTSRRENLEFDFRVY